MSIRFGVIVPTLNPGVAWEAWIDAIRRQTVFPFPVLVLDSESDDGTTELSGAAGFVVTKVSRREFSHGGTRQGGVRAIMGSVDAVVFLTQDAVLSTPDSLERLLMTFGHVDVAAAYGRQLPSLEATPIAEHARLFNYPVESREVNFADKARLGLKTCFISNSFAAYRVADLMALGGFPDDVILGEDMSVAAGLLMAGKRVAYVADACVFHSHNYTLLQEFRRYFDTGVFHARSPRLLQTFGSANGEGMRFVRSELRYLLQNAPSWIPSAIGRTLAKWLGYKLGKAESLLPLAWKLWCSMHRGYWNRRT